MTNTEKNTTNEVTAQADNTLEEVFENEKTTEAPVEVVESDQSAEVTEGTVEGEKPADAPSETAETDKKEGKKMARKKQQKRKPMGKNKKGEKGKGKKVKKEPVKKTTEMLLEERPEKTIAILKKKFQNPALFDSAIQLAKNGQKAGYERLEFLGDRVVGLVVAEMLYMNFPNEPEGDLAKRFVQLVCAKTLAKIANLWGINDIIRNEDKKLGHSKNVLSDVCEAVLGALYLDSGLESVKEVMSTTWEPLMKSFEHAPQDYKSKLQEWSQKNFQVLPVYQLLEKTGPAHMPEFTVSAEAGPYRKLAKGPSRKQAEQNAAIEILKEINAAII